MEESDSMLVTTIREYIQLPEHINTLSDIKAQELYRLSLQILEQFQADTSEIKNMAAKQQKFRSMAKLNQTLQSTLETQFQLNQLMNPSLPFLRKFMLTVINKFGPGQSLEKSKLIGKKTIQHGRSDENQQLKQWLSEEWIHPSLAHKRPKYKGWILPMTINKNMLKNNINLTRQLNNPALKGNVETALNQTCAKLNQRVKQFEANEGFSRREEEQAQIRLQNIIKTNKEDWAIAKNKLNKLKKKLVQDKIQPESQVQAPPPTSVFKQELEVAEMEAEKKKEEEEVKPKSQLKDTSSESELNLNPIELLKRQAQKKRAEYENEIRAILEQLKEKKAAVEQWEQEKQKIEQKMIADQEKTVKLKQQTIDLKKHVEKRQTILSTLEGDKNIEQQVEKLQQEISTLEEQAKFETKRIEKEIKEIQSDSKQKMEVLSDLKIKLTKIESEYSKICEQITEKEQLKKNVKIMKSGISRLYYHKKISEMEQRWRQTEKQTRKIKASLKQLREKTKISSNMSTRVESQIDNILNVQKTRNEPEVKSLRELMNKCRTAYSNTLNILEEANEVKMQTQQYEVKVHTLSGKNYKQNIQKIQAAMDELNNELRDMSRAKTK